MHYLFIRLPNLRFVLLIKNIYNSIYKPIGKAFDGGTIIDNIKYLLQLPKRKLLKLY